MMVKEDAKVVQEILLKDAYNSLKFKNNAKYYAELTQEAETTAVQAINTAGTNQVNAVQNKGTQVLNSIPADYTELSGEVGNLKTKIFND